MEAIKILLLYIHWLPRLCSQGDPVRSLLVRRSFRRHLSRPGMNNALMRRHSVNLHFRARKQGENELAAAAAEIVEDSNDKYNPHRGWEPYWPGGEWVFIHRTTTGTTRRTTTQPKLCGTTCNHLLAKMGKVCGHRQDQDDIYEVNCPYKQCDNQRIDHLHQYYSFSNYCHFELAKCEGQTNAKWLFIHMGECEMEDKRLYYPVSTAGQAVSRAKAWITMISKSLANHTTRTISWG